MEAIRQDYAKGGITQKELGGFYSVHQVNISKIILNKLWKESK